MITAPTAALGIAAWAAQNARSRRGHVAKIAMWPIAAQAL